MSYLTYWLWEDRYSDSDSLGRCMLKFINGSKQMLAVSHPDYGVCQVRPVAGLEHLACHGSHYEIVQADGTAINADTVRIDRQWTCQ